MSADRPESVWRAGWRALADFVYPRACPGCRRPLEPAEPGWLCGPCAAHFQGIAAPLCEVCGEPLLSPQAGDHPHPRCPRCVAGRAFAAARAAAVYTAGPVENAVLAFKHGGRSELAAPLAAFMAGAARRQWPAGPHDLAVPVPLHPWRRIARGFDQARLLAAAVGRELGLPAGRLLVRRRRTPPQNGSPEARRRNVAGAFRVRRAGSCRGARVLLVDDVLTTGATVEECARCLLAAGAAGVDVLTLARASRRPPPLDRA